MIRKIADAQFEKAIHDSFYSVVVFYSSVQKAGGELNTLEEFSKINGSVNCAAMDITGQKIPDDYGIDENVVPIVVVFKQGSPVSAITDITVNNIAGAIAPPGKNITLQ